MHHLSQLSVRSAYPSSDEEENVCTRRPKGMRYGQPPDMPPSVASAQTALSTDWAHSLGIARSAPRPHPLLPPLWHPRASPSPPPIPTSPCSLRRQRRRRTPNHLQALFLAHPPFSTESRPPATCASIAARASSFSRRSTPAPNDSHYPTCLLTAAVSLLPLLF